MSRLDASGFREAEGGAALGDPAVADAGSLAVVELGDVAAISGARMRETSTSSLR